VADTILPALISQPNKPMYLWNNASLALISDTLDQIDTLWFGCGVVKTDAILKELSQVNELFLQLAGDLVEKRLDDLSYRVSNGEAYDQSTWNSITASIHAQMDNLMSHFTIIKRKIMERHGGEEVCVYLQEQSLLPQYEQLLSSMLLAVSNDADIVYDAYGYSTYAVELKTARWKAGYRNELSSLDYMKAIAGFTIDVSYHRTEIFTPAETEYSCILHAAGSLSLGKTEYDQNMGNLVSNAVTLGSHGYTSVAGRRR